MDGENALDEVCLDLVCIDVVGKADPVVEAPGTAPDGSDSRCAINRSGESAYADGPVHYVLFDARVGSLERITHETGIAGRRPVVNVEIVDPHQPKVRISDWCDRWLESLERKPSTVGSYRSTIAHAKRTFGAKYMDELGPDDIAHFNRILRERGCSPSTRAKHLRVLGACLQAAVFYRLCESNPVREVPPAHRPRAERKEAAYFENEELPRLFEQLNDVTSKALCLVALKTGMRQGELFALRWGDVDLEEAVVRVRRSYTGGVVSIPKNRERRDVDLISDVVELLSGWRQTRSASLDDSLVFPGADGRAFLTPTVLLRRHLYPAMARAGIPRVGPTQEKRTFHSFRHTFAKRALETGAQVTWLSRHLGHSSLKVTTDIYGL
jgi:integrase